MIKKLNLANVGLKILGLFGLTTFWGGLIYRLFGLGLFGLILSAALITLSFIILLKIERKYNLQNFPAVNLQVPERNRSSSLGSKLSVIIYLGLLAGCFYILSAAGTTKSIVSPWEVVPAYFFVVYFFATAILCFSLISYRKINLLLVGLHFFLTYSVILFIYRLGFGYDYFIHQATLELIDKRGLVEPRPIYYLGQYGLLAILHKLSGLPLAWLHRLLVPLSAAIFLPLLLYRSRYLWLKEKFQSFCPLLVLAIPLPFLAFTTPQNFALLLLLFVILLGTDLKNYYELVLIAILALATLLTHPVAGMPAVLLVLALVIRDAKISAWFRRLSFSAIFILTAVLLPLAFYVFEKPKLSLTGWSLGNLLPSLAFSSAGSDNIIFNFIYFYGYNFWLVLIIFSVAGLWLARKSGYLARLMPNLLVAAGLFIAYLLTKILPFNFLIGYERDDYSQRILLAACLFLTPFIVLSISALVQSVSRQNLFFKTGWLVFAILLLCASSYLTYPRFDRYFNSRGYSVSETDIAAADWIEQDSRGDYIVLANQQVSVAALSRFGFKKYYPGNIFYYPIPTGGPLYDYYLEMVYRRPGRETMAKATAFAGVKQGYFVLNKYWTDFAKVQAEAKLSADSWREFGEGKVYVFKYRLTD